MKNSYASTELLTPVLDGGIHTTNFFNGRLLSAEDMQREQHAGRLQRRQLGQAIGDGVVYGLGVRDTGDVSTAVGKAGRTVSVSAGMAINRLGQALYLPADMDVSLVREKEVVDGDAGLFSPCSKMPDTDLLSGTGVYILVITPASGYEGQAPAGGVSSGDLSARGGCRRRDAVEGVQFRLVRVKLESLPNTSAELLSDIVRCATAVESGTDKAKNLSLLRNLLAHICFGTGEFDRFVRDPFRKVENEAPQSSYGVVDALRSGKIPALTDCDVPLGLVYWTSSGIQFVDQWSVRRRTVSKPASASWPVVFSERRRAEAEARFEQFQEQLNQLLAENSSPFELSLLTATGWFRYLPAAGMIPVSSASVIRYMQENNAAAFNATSSITGLDPVQFLERITCRKAAFLEGARIGHLFSDSLTYPPVDLNSPTFLFLYLVRENVEGLKEPVPPRPYLIFTSGSLPYYGNARFDLARYDFSSYAFV
ncbi:MAG: hypothetical protein PHI31_02230 [Desulfuromonadaceae bacterium]|nr:hypothetical protein [Desulfuromonadaceae bacterium]